MDIPDKRHLLNSAARQYRHNTDSVPGFVIAYEKETIAAGLNLLYRELARLRAIEKERNEMLDFIATIVDGVAAWKNGDTRGKGKVTQSP